jgi:hypothetical protein
MAGQAAVQRNGIITVQKMVVLALPDKAIKVVMQLVMELNVRVQVAVAQVRQLIMLVTQTQAQAEQVKHRLLLAQV